MRGMTCSTVKVFFISAHQSESLRPTMDSPYKIPAAEPQMLPVGGGAEAREIPFIAQHLAKSEGPGLFWLSGFMSDMSSTKATAVAQWAAAHNLSSARF